MIHLLMYKVWIESLSHVCVHKFDMHLASKDILTEQLKVLISKNKIKLNLKIHSNYHTEKFREREKKCINFSARQDLRKIWQLILSRMQAMSFIKSRLNDSEGKNSDLHLTLCYFISLHSFCTVIGPYQKQI